MKLLKGIHKFDFLVALYVFCILVSEMMGGKTFPLAVTPAFSLNASVAIFLLPVVFSINDIITEVHGAGRARSVVRTGLLMVAFLFLFSLLATSLPPSMRFIRSEAAYDLVFRQSARISLASLVAFMLADFMDVAIFARMRKSLGRGGLWLRNNISNFVSQFIDTAVFMTLAFYAWDKPWSANVAFLASLILPYWGLKCFMSVIETPFVYAGVRWLRGR